MVLLIGNCGDVSCSGRYCRDDLNIDGNLDVDGSITRINYSRGVQRRDKLHILNMTVKSVI